MDKNDILKELEHVRDLKKRLPDMPKEQRSWLYKRLHSAEDSLQEAADQMAQMSKVSHLF